MYLAMISIYNKFIEKLYKLDNIKLYLTNCYNFNKRQKKRQIIVLFAAMLRCPRAKIQLKNDIFFINKKIL